MASNYFTTCSTNTVATGSGLEANHNYSILAVFNLTSTIQLVKIRNPRGNGEWKGAYSDSDSFWTNSANSAYKSAVNF